MIKVNAMSYARLIELLMRGGRSMPELAQETGLHVSTVSEYCRELKKRQVLFIERFREDRLGRESIVLYRLGFGLDAVRRKLSSAERQRRSREKRARLADRILRRKLPPTSLSSVFRRAA